MGSLVNMNEVWAELLTQAPGLVIALLILIGLYRLLSKFGTIFVETQQEQAKSMASQATSMTGLTSSIGDFIRRDNTGHKETMILLKVVRGEIRELREASNDKE